MTATTILNTSTELLITLAMPVLILMKLSVMEHLGVFQDLIFGLTLPLVWVMCDIIRNKKIDLFDIPEMPFVLRTGDGYLLGTQLKAETEPQTAFATVTGQRIRP
jgi:hypothetical protein